MEDKTQKKSLGPAVLAPSAALFQEPWDAAPHFLSSWGPPQFLGSLPQQDTMSHRSLLLVAAESAQVQLWAQPKRSGVRQPLLFRLPLTLHVCGDAGCLPHLQAVGKP